jgi:hypothetical protein
VDNKQDAAICKFCHTPFIVEKAIQQYNIASASIQAGVVNVSLHDDFTIRAGTLIEYSGADVDVTIPDGVTEIGRGAFSGCTGLTSVSIPDGVTEIGEYAFKGCTGLASVSIPGSVTQIGRNAFVGCESLTSLSIAGSVTQIGEGAFKGCKNLSSVSIPDSVLTQYGKISWLEATFASAPVSATLTEHYKKLMRNLGKCWNCGFKAISIFGKCTNCKTRQ